MLQFFPTPYPDELWYSVLCRYHACSGNIKHATTIAELFGGKAHASMGAFFPNNAIYDVVSQLPEGVMDIRDIILRHTLFPYHLRMAPLERKQSMLRDLCEGTSTTPTHIWKSENSREVSLRYCPECRNEDKSLYGEPYWHRTHQIPLVSVCEKHGCRLVKTPVGRCSKLNEHFYAPGEYCVTSEPDYTVAPYELPLAKMVKSYCEMPLEVCPTKGYSNLAQALANQGFRAILSRCNITLDHVELYEALCGFYGEEMTRQYFGEKSAAVIMARICNWKLLSPERYIMLATMIGQPAEVTFGRGRVLDVMEVALRNMSTVKDIWAKKYVAERLGIKSCQLDAVAERYGVAPFWTDSRKKDDGHDTMRTEHLKASFTKQEKAEIESYIQDHGFASVSDFLRFCVRREMEM